MLSWQSQHITLEPSAVRAGDLHQNEMRSSLLSAQLCMMDHVREEACPGKSDCRSSIMAGFHFLKANVENTGKCRQQLFKAIFSPYPNLSCKIGQTASKQPEV